MATSVVVGEQLVHACQCLALRVEHDVPVDRHRDLQRAVSQHLHHHPGRDALPEPDIEAGLAADVWTLGYANKPGKDEAFRDAGADVVVGSMTELAEATGRTPAP